MVRVLPFVEFDRGRWDNGDGMDTTITFIDVVDGMKHRLILGTDGSWVEGFPKWGLRMCAGGFADFGAELNTYYGEDD